MVPIAALIAVGALAVDRASRGGGREGSGSGDRSGLGVAVEEAGDRRGVGGERGPVDDVLVAGGDGEDSLADGEGSVDVDDGVVGEAGAGGERDDRVGADRRGGGGGGGLGEGEGIAGEGSGGGGGEGRVGRAVGSRGVGRGDGEGGLSDGEGSGNEGEAVVRGRQGSDCGVDRVGAGVDRGCGGGGQRG